MKSRLIILMLVLVATAALVACGSGGESLSLEPVADSTGLEQPSIEEALAPVVVEAESAAEAESADMQPAAQGVVVDVKPMSDAELAAQPSGETAPGGAAGDPAGQTDPGVVEPAPAGGQVIYSDAAYGFTVAHPSDFVVAPQDTTKLAQFSPVPLSSIFFMNPTMAAGDLAGLEPPDLEVRVYDAAGAASLEAWLVGNAFVPAETSPVGEPFQSGAVAGLEVCASTMIAPGCSIYMLHNGRVYQMTAATLEGESMVNTFAFTG